VTGAGSGIGWGICLECTREGAKVIVTDIDQIKGKEVLRNLLEISLGHKFCPLDVRNISAGKSLVKKFI
jgi:NAD(P)-dependent dehydrogenase (short-subunit alcohol dehydrogenase family)